MVTAAKIKHMLELEDPELSDVFRALANPARRAMVDRLATGPAAMSELAEPLDMTLSAVEQHVKVLRRCRLVSTEKRGRVRTCRLEPAALRSAETWITERRLLWERRLDRLGEFLDDDADTEASS